MKKQKEITCDVDDGYFSDAPYFHNEPAAVIEKQLIAKFTDKIITKIGIDVKTSKKQ